jgi:hypothetical protein
MEKKRPGLVELRRQRELIGRITVGALVGALAFVLVSCQTLTSRDPQAASDAYGPQRQAMRTRDRSPRMSYESQAASPTDEHRGGS